MLLAVSMVDLCINYLGLSWFGFLLRGSVGGLQVYRH